MDVAMSVHEGCRAWNLSSILETNLENEGITEFFEIQTKAIPQLLDCDRCGIARDITISAPTGSGKTLVYVLPLIQSLLGRIVPRIRALVVVPNRDLAQQVKATFDAYVSGTDLRVGILCGGVNTSSELQYYNDESWMQANGKQDDILQSCEKVDIVITTPGRLVEQIKNNPAFDIQDLQYLVVDEADKLLLQSYNNWIHVLYSRLDELPKSSFEHRGGYVIHSSTNRSTQDNGSLHVVRGIRKILLSATLNSESNINLQKLRLNNLLVYTAKNLTKENVFMVPEQLHEFYYVTDTLHKPLTFIRLIDYCMRNEQKVLVFCNSIDMTHRVYLLLTIFYADKQKTSLFGEYSSRIPASKREQTMRSFQEGSIRLLISSDTIARGVDIPSIDVVINYDLPFYTESYIHRSGRTARAMREGEVYSLVKPEQERYFHAITRKIQGSHPTKLEEDIGGDDFEARYIASVSELQKMMKKS